MRVGEKVCRVYLGCSGWGGREQSGEWGNKREKRGRAGREKRSVVVSTQSSHDFAVKATESETTDFDRDLVSQGHGIIPRTSSAGSLNKSRRAHGTIRHVPTSVAERADPWPKALPGRREHAPL